MNDKLQHWMQNLDVLDQVSNRLATMVLSQQDFHPIGNGDAGPVTLPLSTQARIQVVNGSSGSIVAPLTSKVPSTVHLLK